MHDQSMETKSRSQKILLFIIFLNFLGQYCYAGNISIYDKVHLGVILDMSTKEGKMVHSCISMAISDFYGRHHNYTTRVVLHTRDSKGQHLQVLSSVYIVHLSQDLLYQILINAKQLGMMSKGYAWFMSATTMNLLQFVDSSVFRSMQGVIGLKSYVPASEDLQDFNSRLRRKIYIENPNMEVMESSVYGIRAYDSMWAVAEAVERTKVKPSPVSAKPEIRLNLHDLGKSKPSKHGSILLTEILKRRFRGLSGEFMFENGRNMSSNSFEMVNVIGRGERRIGFWTWAKTGIKEPHGRRNLLSPADLEAILWPGGTTATPKGQFRRGMNVIKLRIGVPMKIGFKELVRVNYDVKKNATIVTGFCTDVFKSAIDLLPYGVEYQFIPFVNASGLRAGTYNDLVHQVNLQVFRKGSPLVHDMSRAIEKLREEGELERLEIQWFKSKSISTFDDSSNVPSALNLKNFGGLFLISGFSSGLALILFLTLVFKEKMQLPKPYKLGYLRQQVQDVRKYLFNKVRNVEVGGSNA
ncbi:hypothetical protein FEM48_Zijuj09G0145500 [Ziziphus jujuba var. spinosa]|uniref:Receptor ligand binding region domain-containing protein n=1 Tax=Ziziphus jujuba var. spinosa TaxID=714518 RepID=A0A978UTJ2_ZIZJJ|nr:hypothetical protein FEM48_Zijuj09G0145500 [Ziziphus jujuba var. spinosa]